MFCSRCGAQNPDHARWCSACGNTFGPSAPEPAPPPPTAAPPPAPAPPPGVAASPYGPPPPQGYASPYGPPPPGPPQYPPYYPPAYPPQAYGPPPESYLVWSILATLLCCLPFGVVAIIYSTQVSSKSAAGDFVGALAASKNAKTWCWVSFGCGLLVGLLYMMAMIAGAAAG